MKSPQNSTTLPPVQYKHILLGAHQSESKHECFLLKDLAKEEKQALQLNTVPTKFCHRELFKVDVEGLEMLDRLATIGYRVVGMSSQSPAIPIPIAGANAFWWTLVRDLI